MSQWSLVISYDDCETRLTNKEASRSVSDIVGMVVDDREDCVVVAGLGRHAPKAPLITDEELRRLYWEASSTGEDVHVAVEKLKDRDETNWKSDLHLISTKVTETIMHVPEIAKLITTRFCSQKYILEQLSDVVESLKLSLKDGFNFDHPKTSPKLGG